MVIGALSGLMAIAFDACLSFSTHWLLGSGGYQSATVAGNRGGFHPASEFGHPWAIPLIAGAGALIAAVLVFRVAPETQGHGTDAAISSIHQAPKAMRARAALVKLIASVITIGSGGSGGSEGPTAQIAATSASVLARRLRLSEAEARVAVTAGLASGVAAIFRAPLGGAVLSIELLFRDDFEPVMLLPSLIASFVAFAEFGAVFGFTPMFGSQPGTHMVLLAQFPLYFVLGLCAGLIGRLYSWTFYRIAAWFGRLPLPRAVWPGVAGLATGALGLAVPGVLGTGYGTIQDLLEPHHVLQMSLLVLIAIPFAKIAATSLSIGSGGSGGVFGPGLVIGAALGAAMWRLAEPLGLAPSSPVPLIIVGMAACLGAAAHAPMSIALVAVETTGSLALLGPAAIAMVPAVLVVGRETLYRSQPSKGSGLTIRERRNAKRVQSSATTATPAAVAADSPAEGEVPSPQLR